MKNVGRIWRYLKDYRMAVGLYVLFALLAQLFSVVSFGIVGPIMELLFVGNRPLPASEPGVDAAFTDKFIWMLEEISGSRDKVMLLAFVCITVIVFVFLKNVFTYLGMLILFPVRHDLTRRLRNDMFSKLLTLPIGYFTDEKKGDLMSRMTNDVNEVRESVMSVMEVFIREPIAITVMVSGLIFISPKLTLFILILLPFAALTVGKVGSSLRRAARRLSQQMSDINSVLDETLGSMRVVKAFNAEKHQYLRFLKLNNENFRERNRVARLQELASPLSETMGVVIVAAILWFGGRLVLQQSAGALEAGLFISYIVLFTQVINPFKNLTSAINIVQKGSAALGRMEEVLQTVNTVEEVLNPVTIRSFEHSIELRNVHFSYGDRKILDGINLIIEKGKSVALVGSSGAGKSTLADLLPRFHDVSEGEILLDGVNIKNYKLDALRRLFGVVSQEPILFNDTVQSNITLGTGGASLADVQNAARVAHAQGFIEAKPEGYETVVGDRGSRLSGGERQRVTIARAVLKNPPIMILDEATSSLDTESERIVQEAINNLMQSRTSIVIAHRLSTVKGADEIVVLDKGRIVERGTHADLIARGGYYHRLVEMQEVR